MEWSKIKETLYFEDGALRDIYVKGTTRDDWEKWANFVNQNYAISYRKRDVDAKELIDNKVPIKIQEVFDYWDGPITAVSIMAVISINDIHIHTYLCGRRR
jgi:hypothetical protein